MARRRPEAGQKPTLSLRVNQTNSTVICDVRVHVYLSMYMYMYMYVYMHVHMYTYMRMRTF